MSKFEFKFGAATLIMERAKPISECKDSDLDTQCIIDTHNENMVNAFWMFLVDCCDHVKTIVTTPMIGSLISVEFGFHDDDEAQGAREVFHENWDACFNNNSKWVGCPLPK